MVVKVLRHPLCKYVSDNGDKLKILDDLFSISLQDARQLRHQDRSISKAEVGLVT